jgi:hypothetical protein
MSRTKPKAKYPPLLRLTQIAEAYQVNPQKICSIRQFHGLDLDDFLSPADLHAHLIRHGNASPFRNLLGTNEYIATTSRRLIAMLEAQSASRRNHQALASYVATGEAPKAFADKNWMLDTFRALILAQVQSDIASENQSHA